MWMAKDHGGGGGGGGGDKGREENEEERLRRRGRAKGRADREMPPSKQARAGLNHLQVQADEEINGILNNNNQRKSRSNDEEVSQEGQREARFGRGLEIIQTRPSGFDKRGSSGIPQNLLSNYFLLQVKTTVQFRLYVATFDPEIESIGKRKALIRTVENRIGPYLFEGTQIFTTREIEPGDMNFVVSFPDKADAQWNVKIEFLRVCDPKEPVLSQLYNVIIKKAQDKLNLALLGRHYFDGVRKITIHNHRLELWPGYVTSMRQMETEVLLNLDLTFKVCRMDDVFSLMKQIRSSAHPDTFKKECEKAIVGTIVMTRHNQATYKITSIDWNLRPTNAFTTIRKGLSSETTFLEYFASKGIHLKNPSQPMLVSSPSAREVRRGDTGDKILPPELCFQTGLNEEMRANFRLMKDLACHLHMDPSNRLSQSQAFVQRILANSEITNEMLRWGMRFNANPAEVQGRVLPSEELRFQTGVVKVTPQADWTMAFRNNLLALAKPMKNWAIVFTSKDGDGIGQVINTMQRVARPLGFVIPHPVKQVRLSDSNSSSFVRAIENTVNELRGQVDMMMIILPNNRIETYAAVKKSCSLNFGIPSQCFLSKNVTAKGLMSICTKLVVQMNAKLGGQPWGLNNPLKGLMVVGFDVHHGGGKSFGAMTATMSQNLAAYFSTVMTMESRFEMANEIGPALRKCMYAYRQINGCYPSRVMFYRDGVGEGQLRYVAQTEASTLKALVQDVTGQEAPVKFSMIVVTKRINTRLFLSPGPGKIINPVPGTVVDSRITCPEKYDFYLVPQTARQGTVSPTGFNVISDDSGLDADKMQRFAFKLCHGYFNWSGTVAVPAPCQYARKLAFLTGTALLSEANEKLLNQLHYL